MFVNLLLSAFFFQCETARISNSNTSNSTSAIASSSYQRIGAGECCTPAGQGPYVVVDSAESLSLCERRCTATAGCSAVTYKGPSDTSPNICHALHFASATTCSQFCSSQTCNVNHCQDQTPTNVDKYTKSDCRDDPSSWSCYTSTNSSPCTASGSLDLRISKAIGSRGYSMVRLSVVSDGTPVSSKIFSYQEPFQHRWSQFALSSGMVLVTPGGETKVEVGGNTACLRVPAQGEGVRGLLFGDPCIVGGTCGYVSQFNVKDRLTDALNKASSRNPGNNPIDFWAILGDNFYDQKASIDRTPAFFGSLSQDTKSTIMMTVPGNHDFWVNGAPDNGNVLCDDQFGNGFMQYYGQDSLAASNQADPAQLFNFSVRPPPTSSADCSYDQGWTASEDNFFFYHVIGNVGFVGYSGHTKYSTQRSNFAQACSYFANMESVPKEVVLLGHWSEGGHGGVGEDVGIVQDNVRRDFPRGCGKIKAFFGHQHCNLIDGEQASAYNSGDGKCDPALAGKACFQHGATGYAGNSDCGSDADHWGVLYFDTTSSSGFLDLWYYPLGATVAGIATDTSAKLLSCLDSHSFGDEECKQYGQQWLSPSSPV